MSLIIVMISPIGQRALGAADSRSPQEIIRYLQLRLQGHDTLQTLVGPALRAMQARYERAPPSVALPTLGKGQQTQSMAESVPLNGSVTRVWSAAALAKAMLSAAPGTHIVIEPGTYRFEQTLVLGNDGRAGLPIVVGAIRPGSVQLEFAQESGIQVNRPHWTFENLNIRGVCVTHGACEHAFHVVGRGAFAVLRNNRIEDFNAHIKVNGLNGDWPDHGVLAFNTLRNGSARATRNPVAMLDLVGASHWRVHDNFVTSFAKSEGNQIAYGLFMKGASEGGRIERNLVVCSPDDLSAPGLRVGISFGGGGGNAEAICREDACRQFQHRHGLAANNVVAHCNDAGMDINASSDIVLAHNTLINTAGFLARGAPTQATLFGNLYEGRLMVRNGASMRAMSNLQSDMRQHFLQPDVLFLQWFDPPSIISASRFVTDDFRGERRGPMTLPGAFEAPSPGRSTGAGQK